MQREEIQKNLLQLASSSNNASAISQTSKDVERTNIEKFNVPSEYPVGIDLPEALANPGSDATSSCARATVWSFLSTMVR